MGSYELEIRKEVLDALVNGVYAQYLNEAVLRNKPPSLIKMSREVYALSGAVMYAKTMEELEIINEKLLEYGIKLSKIQSGEILVD